MELLKKIRKSSTTLLVVLSVNFSYTQNKETIIVINDTIKNYSSLLNIENVKVIFDKLNVVEVNFWPSKNISLILFHKKDNQYLQLGFDYAGKIISQKECSLISDKVILNGKAFFYDNKGNISHCYTYEDGLFNGIYISYFTNGMIETFGQYSKGEKKGNWLFYLKSGKLKYKKKY